MVCRLPDARTEWLADAKTNTNSNADNQECDEDLHNDPVPFAKAGHTLARPIVNLGGLCLSSPVILARPDWAIGFGFCSVARRSLVQVLGGFG